MSSSSDSVSQCSIVVTGSNGHLGSALVRVLRAGLPFSTPLAESDRDLIDEPTAEALKHLYAQLSIGNDQAIHIVGVDIAPGPETDVVADIADREAMARMFKDHAAVQTVFHTATLHKPHVQTHTRQQFVDTNITGTLILLELAVAHHCRAFIFTSTTSVYSKAISGHHAASATSTAGGPMWVDEETTPMPKNVYGVTKVAAEGLAALSMRLDGLNVVVLRTSRFFTEPDDDASTREAFTDANIKTCEFLYRRVDVADVVQAHLRAAADAPLVVAAHRSTPAGSALAPIFVISAPPLLKAEDCAGLLGGEATRATVLRRAKAPALLDECFTRRNWKYPALDRVYDSEKATTLLGWQPQYTFETVVGQLADGSIARRAAGDSDPIIGSALAAFIGRRGYHGSRFEGSMDAVGQPYPAADRHA
jgi:UDP-glucose 4-epimerase